MSEPAQLAKAAREQLAKALNALQSDDKVPNELIEAADPIADAMGILHKIEKSNGATLDGRPEALKHVRTALDRLQQVTSDHPAVETVMEAVAASLTKVHGLVRYNPPAPPVVAAPPPAPAPAPVLAPAPIAAQPVVGLGPRGTVMQMNRPQQQAPAPEPSAPQAQAQQPYVPPPPAFSLAPQQPFAVPAPQQPFAAPAPQQPYVAPAPQQPYVAPQQPYIAPAPQQPYVAPQQPQTVASAQPGQAAQRAPVPAALPSGKGGAIDVELGTHSPSNFYKGLGGNDVIDHGGIFVATYKIPKIGASVLVRVLLPGDLEFQATALVQWTREAAGSSEPGFGARFSQITAEGRQLVYRYTRNREPMFYDDL